MEETRSAHTRKPTERGEVFRDRVENSVGEAISLFFYVLMFSLGSA